MQKTDDDDGDGDGGNATHGEEEVIVVGLCRRRRTLSKKLTFIDVEPTPATPPPTASASSSSSSSLIQLLCEWRVPVTVVAGLRIEARGAWETRAQRRGAGGGGGRDDAPDDAKEGAGDGAGEEHERERTGRFSVGVDGLIVLEDCRGESAWHNAAENAAWRLAQRRRGRAGGVEELRGESNTTTTMEEEEEKETSSSSRGDEGGAAVAAAAATNAMMCLSWADFGWCGDPSCTSRHAAATRWEKRRRDRAARRREEHDTNHQNHHHLQPDAVVSCECAHGDVASKSKHNLVFAQWLAGTGSTDSPTVIKPPPPPPPPSSLDVCFKGAPHHHCLNEPCMNHTPTCTDTHRS